MLVSTCNVFLQIQSYCLLLLVDFGASEIQFCAQIYLCWMVKNVPEIMICANVNSEVVSM